MTKNKLKAFIYHSAIWETIRRWMFCGFSPTCLCPLLGYSGTRLAVQLYQSVVVSCICHLTLDVASLSGAVVLQQEQPDLEKRAAGHSEGS